MRTITKALLFLLFTTSAYAQKSFGNFTSFDIKGKAVVVNADTSSLRMVFLKPDIIKVDLVPSQSAKFDTSMVVIQDTTFSVPLSIQETDSTLQVTSASIRVVFNKYPLRVSYYSTSGKLLLSDRNTNGFTSFGNSRTVEFSSQPDEHFYGTGERGTTLDKRGQSFESYNTQMGGYTSPLSVMMINIPFVASTAGYGLYFENTYRGNWDLGRSNSSKYSYSVSAGELSYYLIAAPSVQEQIEQYTWLTGRQPLPPRWSMGYIQSRFGYRNETDARAMIQTMRQKKIPCDAIVLDLYWFKNMGDISWDLSQWNNPFGMMTDFLNLGIKTIVITEPYITENTSNYYEAYYKNYFTKNAQGKPYILTGWWSCQGCNAGLLDLTNPNVQNWWWSLHPSFFGNQLAGIWTDLGEPERHPNDMYHYLGSTEKVHNIYNLLWAKTIFDGFKQLRPGERIFNLTRSGYAGIQRYGVIPWSGDVGRSFGGLAVQLPMLLNMGISGLGYQNSDIGGFTGNGTTELYVRWMQFGVFSPITRAHGTGQPTEPWAFGTEAEGINKKFIELRYRMIPYNYTLAYENFKTGIPLARPLFFEYPEDNNLYSLSSSYLWGSSILVAPVVEAGQSSKSVYLPDGDWIDFWSDKIYSGHKNITVATPLDKIPLFIRRGSIIPMQPLMNYSDEHTLDTLFLSIYPSHSREAYYRLYEDDGKTLQYQSGRYAETIFTQYISSTATGEELVLNIGATQGDYNGKLLNRTYIADIHLVSGHPQAIKKNSLPLQFRNSLDEMRQTEEGCYYDSLNSRLYIQIKTIPDSSYKIVVSDLDLLSSASEGKSTLARYQLAQNYPNPFNPVTTIRYGVAERSHVRLKIYDALGREIRILVDQDELPGNHQVEFDARDLPSGIYIYEIQAGSYRESKKMNFIK